MQDGRTRVVSKRLWRTIKLAGGEPDAFQMHGPAVCQYERAIRVEPQQSRASLL
jgi:hypothetical protein